jgi:hypothetical protein
MSAVTLHDKQLSHIKVQEKDVQLQEMVFSISQREPISIQIFSQPLVLNHVAIWPADACELTHLAAEMSVFCTQTRKELMHGAPGLRLWPGAQPLCSRVDHVTLPSKRTYVTCGPFMLQAIVARHSS